MVKADFPEKGTISADEIFENKSTSRDEHRLGVQKAWL